MVHPTFRKGQNLWTSSLIGQSSQTKLWLEFCLTAWANQVPSSKIMSLQKFRMTSLFELSWSQSLWSYVHLLWSISGSSYISADYLVLSGSSIESELSNINYQVLLIIMHQVSSINNQISVLKYQLATIKYKLSSTQLGEYTHSVTKLTDSLSLSLSLSLFLSLCLSFNLNWISTKYITRLSCFNVKTNCLILRWKLF